MASGLVGERMTRIFFRRRGSLPDGLPRWAGDPPQPRGGGAYGGMHMYGGGSCTTGRYRLCEKMTRILFRGEAGWPRWAGDPLQRSGGGAYGMHMYGGGGKVCWPCMQGFLPFPPPPSTTFPSARARWERKTDGAPALPPPPGRSPPTGTHPPGVGGAGWPGGGGVARSRPGCKVGSPPPDPPDPPDPSRLAPPGPGPRRVAVEGGGGGAEGGLGLGLGFGPACVARALPRGGGAALQVGKSTRG